MGDIVPLLYAEGLSDELPNIPLNWKQGKWLEGVCQDVYWLADWFLLCAGGPDLKTLLLLLLLLQIII